jgi:hypothetical protein
MLASRRRLLLAGGFVTLLLAVTFRATVEGDGVGYMAYLHSMWVDHDLSFSNEYRAALAAGVPTDHRLIGVPTATGLVANYFPMGAAVLASPFYLVALALHPSGEPQFGAPFTIAFTLASLLAGLLALAVCWRQTGSALAVVAITLGTPFFFYLVYAPGYSHMFSALAVSLFVFLWWRGRDRRSVAGWLALGLLGGLMALIRFQDGLLLLICLLDVRRAGWKVLLVLPGAVLVFLPQVLVDMVVFGGPLPQRPAGQQLTLFPGHYLQVLFASWNGLFVWNPLTLAAVAGMLMVRDRALRAACLFAFLLETAIDGAAPDWWGGLAFGARRFLDMTPFFAIGLAAIARRVDRRVAWGAVAAATVWSLLLAANLIYEIRTEHDPGYAGLLLGQVHAVRWLPNLLAKGDVLRHLAVWPLLGRSGSPLTGLVLLCGQALAVAVAGLLAFRRQGERPLVHAYDCARGD